MLQLPDNEMTIGYSPAESLRSRQILDVTLASLPTLLRYEDGNSMGNSIESRLPFVDYRVMECGIALPAAMKLRGGYGKWIVRRAMAGKLPDAVRMARYKKGFDVRQDGWIDAGLGEFMRGMLHERSARIRPWLVPGAKIDEVFSNAGTQGPTLCLRRGYHADLAGRRRQRGVRRTGTGMNILPVNHYATPFPNVLRNHPCDF